MGDAARSRIAAAISGILSYAACLVTEGLGARWGAGLVFGALVLAPSRRETRDRVVAIALSAAVYRAAFWLADRLHVDASWPVVVACALAGVLGAVALSIGSSVAFRTRADARATAWAAAAGAVAGAVIGVGIEAPDESLAQRLLLLTGFVAWQLGYTVAHRLRPWSRQAS